MYESYYGFEKKPFSINPDPDFLYLNANYREALALLQYGIYECKGIVCLIGEVGTGKTMLLNQLIGSLEEKITALLVPITRFTYNDLIDYLLIRFGITDASRGMVSRFDILLDYLKAETMRGKTFALLVDEAQNLDNETLENLRLLSNLETPKRKLLQIILVGQPELRDKLNLPELRQFKQRIAVNFSLMPLTEHEVPQYIAHRLKSAGYVHGLTLFSDDALTLIAAYTGGIPRLINSMCDNVLLIGFAQNKHHIDVPIVEEAARDLLLEQQPGKPLLPRESAVSITNDERVDPDLKKPSNHHWRWITLFILFGLAGAGWYLAVNQTKYPWINSSLISMENLWNRLDLKLASLSQLLWHTDPNEKSSGELEPRPSAPVENRDQFHKQDRLGESSSLQNTTTLLPAPGSVAAAESAMSESDDMTRDYPAAGVLTVPAVTGMKKSGTDYGSTIAPSILWARLAYDDSTSAKTIAGDAVVVNPILPESPSKLGHFAEPDNSKVSVMPRTDPKEKSFPKVSESSKELLDSSIEDEVTTVTVKIVKNGENISSLAAEVYGKSSLYELALIQIANPEIINIDFVHEGQKIFFPQLYSGTLVFKQGDKDFRIFLGASNSLDQVEKWQSQLAVNSIKTNVISAQLSNSIKIYRLEISGFMSKKLAVEKIAELTPFRTVLLESREN